MNVVVVGLGSMGKRRIRLIKKYDSSFNIYGVDINEDRRVLCGKEYGIIIYSELEDAINKQEIDCAFICTAPLSHNDIINKCLQGKINVFTELNLVATGYKENTELAKKNNLVLFLSSTFMYREEIKEIKSLVKDCNCNLNYTYHIGQYLPDWHPWENYTDFFVGDKLTNGCREIFAIELPWLIDVFGEISIVCVTKNNISNLNIDYADNYLLIVEHCGGNKGVLAVDIISRKAVRNIEIFGEELFVRWDGSAEGLSVFNYNDKVERKIKLYDSVDQLEEYSEFVVENAYYEEVVTFFDIITNGGEPSYTFLKDEDVLRIIDEIEA